MNRDRPIGEHLQSLVGDLRQAGYSLETIAREAGIAKSTAWKLANGEARMPGFDTVRKLENLHGKMKG